MLFSSNHLNSSSVSVSHVFFISEELLRVYCSDGSSLVVIPTVLSSIIKEAMYHSHDGLLARRGYFGNVLVSYYVPNRVKSKSKYSLECSNSAQLDDRSSGLVFLSNPTFFIYSLLSFLSKSKALVFPSLLWNLYELLHCY